MLDQAVQRFCAAAARFSVRRGWSGDVEVARTPCLVIKVAAALGLAADGGVVQGEVGGLGAHGNAVPAADTTDLPPTDGAGRQRRKTVPRLQYGPSSAVVSLQFVEPSGPAKSQT